LKWLEAPSVRRGSLKGCPCVLIDQNAGRSCIFCGIILSNPGCPQNPAMVTCRFSATLAKAAARSAVLSPLGNGPPLRPAPTQHMLAHALGVLSIDHCMPKGCNSSYCAGTMIDYQAHCRLRLSDLATSCDYYAKSTLEYITSTISGTNCAKGLALACMCAAATGDLTCLGVVGAHTAKTLSCNACIVGSYSN
jgi:hypothetical protein